MARKRQRRSPGTGSIYYRKSDERWVAQITLGPNQRHSFYSSSREEAEASLDEALHQHRAGRLIIGPALTLTEYLHAWLEDTVKPRVRQNTYELQVYQMAMVCRDPIGTRKLQDIKSMHVRACYAALLADRYEPSTIHRLHSTLKCAFDQAIEDELIVRNPARGISLPKVEERDQTILTKEQARTLIEDTGGTPLGVLFHVLIGTGMRIGEALALTWGDVEGGSIRITKTLAHHRGTGFETTPPKTKRARRTIIPDPTVIAALRELRTQRLETGYWQDANPIWCNAHGSYIYNTQVGIALRTTLARLKLPHVRIHDLRHTAASLMMADGIPAPVVMEILGHTSITITLGTYSHVQPGMHTQALRRLGQMLASEDTKQPDEREAR